MKCGGFWIACLFHYASVWDYGKLILIHRKGKMVVININFIKRPAPNFVQVKIGPKCARHSFIRKVTKLYISIRPD